MATPLASIDLAGAINLLATVTLFEMMITIGLGVTLPQVGAVARDWKLILRATVANFVLFPLAAAGLLMGFGAAPLVSAGFLIAAVCPGRAYMRSMLTLPNTSIARPMARRASSAE